MMLMTIAIDGPVGAGKSSVADGVAQKLDILHLDTGAMYRAFAWKAVQEGIDTNDGAALCALTERALPEVRYQDGVQRTLIGGQDVSDLIRTPEISMAASNVSKVAGVRKAMVALQQSLAAKQSILLDGRDIGTRVMPDAKIKIFLTASPEVRATRRFEELKARGEAASYEEVLQDVIRRDDQDMNREEDPLRPAEDAQILDASALTLEQVIDDIIRRVRLKQGKLPKRAEPFTPLYRALQWLARLLFSTLIPTTIHGLENALMDAPYILIGNHKSLLDPVAIAWSITRYQIHFLGKKELIKHSVMRWVFKKMQMIPVDRHNMDMVAIRSCLKALKDGHVLGVFPEGTRYKNGLMDEMESGIAMIALRSGLPLLPAYISTKPGLFKRIHVYYGQPIPTAALAAKGINKEHCEELLMEITRIYHEMAEQHEAAKKTVNSIK